MVIFRRVLFWPYYTPDKYNDLHNTLGVLYNTLGVSLYTPMISIMQALGWLDGPFGLLTFPVPAAL